MKAVRKTVKIAHLTMKVDVHARFLSIYNKECIGKRECEEFEYGSFRGKRKKTYIPNSDIITKTYKAGYDIHTGNYKYESINEDKCVYILDNICIMNDVHKTCIGYKKCEHFISLYERRKLSQKRKIEDEFEFKKIITYHHKGTFSIMFLYIHTVT